MLGLALLLSAMTSESAPTLDPTLGSFHRSITTTVALTQLYFDQGMRLLFAFDLEAAERSFREAVRLDPACAMCEWGVAMSLSPHLNVPGIPERTKAAHEAALRARPAAHASSVEKALIAAVLERSSDPAPADAIGQTRLDEAYARAMRAVAKEFARDADVAALAAEAAMDVHPWNYWKRDGTPQSWTPEIEALLEGALRLQPNHPGANHYYIHLLEASPHPERALASAQKVGRLEPGAAHLVHMPSHIFIRVGRYEEAAAANRDAIRVDARVMARDHPQGFYMMYAAHNHFFLAYAALMEGRADEAISEARKGRDMFPAADLRHSPGFDGTLEVPVWMLVRFHRDRAVLAEPAPPADLLYASATWHSARAIAFARVGQLADAEREREEAHRAETQISAEAPQGFNTSRALLAVALPLVDGEIAEAGKDYSKATAEMQAAVAAADRLSYDEPPDWFFPIRPRLAGVFLAAGHPRQAEAICREDLERNPDNGWGLGCLAQSLHDQGKEKAANEVVVRYRRAWARSDLLAPPP
jgi:tetratricopeptide (TPR) repeat protein